MNNKQKILQLTKYNSDYNVTLTYDTCKSGENEYGKWNLYGVKYDGEQQGIFADEHLHDKLKQYGKGAKLVIRRAQDEKGKIEGEFRFNGIRPRFMDKFDVAGIEVSPGLFEQRTIAAT